MHRVLCLIQRAEADDRQLALSSLLDLGGMLLV